MTNMLFAACEGWSTICCICHLWWWR